MMLEKKQTDKNNFKISFLYYDRARDAMADIVNLYFKYGYKDIYLPGYIGWSPKEGSGIFDPLNNIKGLNRHYYRMTKDLYVDVEKLKAMLTNHSVVLLVNYFGFRDTRINEIIAMAHEKDCVIIEDNAHGFFTWYCKGKTQSDATFFSLHKMFPFETGGGLIAHNRYIKELIGIKEAQENNPFLFDINGIARKRDKNYRVLLGLMADLDEYFVPMRIESELNDAVPQTLPIVIKKGRRDKIYELMNEKRYGVVSLYHTMIEELRSDDHEEALWLSKRILNLPVHQDCAPSLYPEMINELVRACEKTA